MKEKIYSIKKRILSHYPYGYRKDLLEATRREVGNKIFEILWTSKLPAVIDLEEQIFHVPPEFPPFEKPDEIIEYRIFVADVRYRDVEIARMPEFDLGYYHEPNLQERITRWIKKKVSRLSNWRSRLSF